MHTITLTHLERYLDDMERSLKKADNGETFPVQDITDTAHTMLKVTNNPRIIETVNVLLDEIMQGNDDTSFHRMMMSVIREEM